jgi:valyl-tRNA synthetase
MAKLDRVVTDIEFNRSVVGPSFRKQAQAFMDAVRALPPEQLEHPPRTIQLEGSDVEIPPNSFTPRFSYMEGGAKVDVVTVSGVIVTIQKAA